MKKFLMGVAALAICVGLTACNSVDGGVTGITGIQSITTQQTVLQTAAEGTENTVRSEKNLQTAEKPVQSEKTVQTADEPYDEPDELYDPCGEVTLPDAIDDCDHGTMVERMFYNGLPLYEYSVYEAGESDYDECNECYKRLLAEHIINHCDRAELFGGAYFCDGWLQVRVTDYGSRDEVIGDFFDGLESVNVSSCNYSYYYLTEVKSIIQQAQAGTSEINVQNNRVDVTVSTETAAEFVRKAVENAGLALDAVHIETESEWEIVSEPRYTEP